MARGGCNNCFTGGSSMPNLLMIITVLGVFLIVFGLIVYNMDILDLSIKPVTKKQMNDYIGYLLIILGTVLLFVVGITQAKAV
jgi:vacuolar-type H+-ATPase subunit I/STV1